MPCMYPFDLALLPDRISYAIQRISRDAVNISYACSCEHLDQELRYVLCHDFRPMSFTIINIAVTFASACILIDAPLLFREQLCSATLLFFHTLPNSGILS